jgi:Mg2+ and Co2+ transporter CorA
MRRLTLVTVIFLPLSAVAGVFGSQFFGLFTDDEWNQKKFRVHNKLYIMFLVSAVMAVAFVLVWWQRFVWKFSAILLRWTKCLRV